MKHSSAPPPFAIFFPLAALDAIAVGCGWIVALEARPATIAEIAVWHQRELLLGFVTAALAGFLLTALPRWTGLRLPKTATPAMLGVWIAARFAPVHPSPYASFPAAPGLLLTFIVAVHIWRAQDRRNAKTTLLLAIHAVSGLVYSSDVGIARRALAMNFCIGAMTGLIVLIGGRVLPALTARFDELRGSPPPLPRGRALERISAVLVVAGIGCWLVSPKGALCASLLAAAGASQIVRMASWFGRRTFDSPPLLALYAAYASIPLGFGLLAFHALAPDAAPASAGLHVWTIGGFGGMSLAIMASMIRKNSHRAFAPSRGAEAAVVLCLGAAAARVCAAFSAEPRVLLVTSAMAWSASFALFLFVFRAPLFEAAFRTAPEPQPRNSRTENRP
ncbi:NnrS family protein [Rhodoblastus sp.]|jgi:uncharacterized protein involved in response to NO|uniref:NnrS family protein n=1 Tax=Rhodoblastus sp. TaxID=1962975 RepID=UPI0025D2ABA2|nr:NnrS family protein [Rhodoblastus sp.]